MLVLTRKVGEQIVIDENVRISVQRIQGGKVRIGIDAPDDVSILRGELVFEMASPESRLGKPCDQGDEFYCVSS